MNEEELQEWTMSGGMNEFLEIPRTWLEVNPFGQVRDARTKDWFGNVVYRDDLKGVVRGELPAYDPYTLMPSTTPQLYFDQRYRNEDIPDLEITKAGARQKVMSAEKFFRRRSKQMNIALGRREDVEEFEEIPETSLEISNFGRIRKTETKVWFGRLMNESDLADVLARRKSARSKTVVMRTNNPGIDYAAHLRPAKAA